MDRDRAIFKVRVSIHTIGVLVTKEIIDSLRNRWFYAFLAIFLVLSFSIIFLGIFGNNSIGFESFNRTTASLLNLILFLIPVITLLLGGTSISSERELGTMNLVLSKPINATELIIGKYLGIAIVLIASIAIGFGLMGMIIAFTVSAVEAEAYLLFVALSALLALSFLSISMLISVLAQKRITAIIISIVVWFFFILVYDIIVMTAANLFSSEAMPTFLLASILLNPAGTVRILATVSLGGQTIFGPSLIELTRMVTTVSSEAIMILGICAWIVVPLLLSIFFFKRSVKK